MHFHLILGYLAGGVAISTSGGDPPGAKFRAQKKVVVEDFIRTIPQQDDKFLSLMDYSGIFMHDLFREGDDICVPDKSFCSDQSGAPSGFCGSNNLQPENFMKMATKQSNEQPGFKFDQFALERIMLGKWKSLGDWAQDLPKDTVPDIVVVPSLRLHIARNEGFSWEVLEPAVYKTRGTHLLELDDTDKIAQAHIDFWKQVCDKWYERYQDKGPTIVMHYSYTWDTQDSLAALRGLSMAPVGCQQRVVLGVIESNLPLHAEYFRQLQGLPEFTNQWDTSGVDELLHRHRGAFSAQPLLLTLPYPTGILNAVAWASSQKLEQRRIKILLDGSTKRNAVIRNDLRDALQKAIGLPTPSSELAMACAWDSEKSKPYCGLDADRHQTFELAASSVFCLEPPGDTVTRSHFYVAIQSGCIPVIFDGGNLAYGNNTVTQWAWRKGTAETEKEDPNVWGDKFFDYRDFALIFSGTADAEAVIQELMSINLETNTTIQSLREGLDRVGARTVYKRETCSPVDDNCYDAFHSFASLIADLPAPAPVPAPAHQAMLITHHGSFIRKDKGEP